jgi:hypothetical protein
MQTESSFTGKLMKASMSSIRRASVGLFLMAAVGLVCFMIVLGLSVSLWAKGGTPPTTPDVHLTPDLNSGNGQASAPPSAADIEKQVRADVDANVKDEQSLLDKLLVVVGLYATILSFLALATVYVSRQDAKEQVAKIDALTTSLKAQVRLEFPFISELQSRAVELIQKLESKYPEEENLNKPKADSWGTELAHEDMLIDELQIVAVSVVVLDAASLLKLYMVLSRSYFDRFRTGTQTDADAARAYLYASRAILCSPKNADAYRMRGVCALSRYRNADAARKTTPEFVDLFAKAKADLGVAVDLDPFNAGAIYNLALLVDIEGNRNRAISLSEKLIDPGTAKRIKRWSQEKYLADVYINLACYFADWGRTENNPADKVKRWDHAVEICEQGKSYLQNELKSTRAVETFRASLNRELQPTKDLAGLNAQQLAKLQALL